MKPNKKPADKKANESEGAAPSETSGGQPPGGDRPASIGRRSESSDAAEQSSGGNSSSPDPSAPPPAPLPRFVAVWNVKASGRYYTPGTAIPPDALTHEMAEQQLSCGAISLIPEDAQ